MAKTGRRTAGEGWSVTRECPKCGRSEERCGCGAAPVATGRPVARLRLEKRSGRGVTVVDLEGLEEAAVSKLLRELRAACSTGGTSRGTTVELQGDHRDRLRAVLEERGYRVKG